MLKKMMLMALLVLVLVPSVSAMGMESERVSEPNDAMCLTESQKCSWTAVPATIIIGAGTGIIGGAITSVVLTYICGHMKLAPTDKFGRHVPH